MGFVKSFHGFAFLMLGGSACILFKGFIRRCEISMSEIQCNECHYDKVTGILFTTLSRAGIQYQSINKHYYAVPIRIIKSSQEASMPCLAP